MSDGSDYKRPIFSGQVEKPIETPVFGMCSGQDADIPMFDSCISLPPLEVPETERKHWVTVNNWSRQYDPKDYPDRQTMIDAMVDDFKKNALEIIEEDEENWQRWDKAYASSVNINIDDLLKDFEPKE